MKKLIFGIVLGISLTALISAGIESYTVSQNTAHVQSFQNVKVFTDSQPVQGYEYLGTVKVTVTMSGQYVAVRDALIKKAKKEYPACEGVILNFKDGGADKADVIKFK